MSLLYPLEYPDSEYVVDRSTLIQTCSNPQILECMTYDGILLYIRFAGNSLTVREKKTNKFITAGDPFLYKGKTSIPIDEVEFFIEMYSKHNISFR